MDNSPIGDVSTLSPLTVSVTPGQHELYAKVSGPVIDRITSGYYEQNKVYYMSVWFEGGMWASSVRITPIPKLTEFEVIKYSFQ